MKSIKIFLAVLLCSGFVFQLSAQMVDKGEGGTFLLRGGQVYDHENGMQGADLLIKDGKISDIGTALSYPDAKVIDCSGLEI